MYSHTRFSSLLKGVPRGVFSGLVLEHQADRYRKQLKCWDILVSMIYGQVQKVSSLRTLVDSFNHQSPYHYHLGTRRIRRSTLSDALASCKPEPYRQLCDVLMNQASQYQRRHIKEVITLIDSTCITLRGRLYDHWSYAHKTKITQGLKVHLALDGQTDSPRFVKITYVNTNDHTVAQQMELRPDSIYVFDKGYCDYRWWSRINQCGSIFVTRLKRNASINKLKERQVQKRSAIVADHDIKFGRTNGYADERIRRIEVKRPGKNNLVLVTNDWTRSAEEIAHLYKQRWQIENYFKWIKQHLKLKKYYGCSENAVKIQIYCALITYLLMQLYRNQFNPLASMTQIDNLLSFGLFHRPDHQRILYQKRKKALFDFLFRQMRLPI